MLPCGHYNEIKYFSGISLQKLSNKQHCQKRSSLALKRAVLTASENQISKINDKKYITVHVIKFEINKTSGTHLIKSH